MAAASNVYCLPEFLVHMTILKIFGKLASIGRDCTASSRKQIDPSSDRSVFQFQKGLSKRVLVL